MYQKERRTYINHILAFQERMGLTNKKMAELLELNEKTYVRFISGEAIQHEFDLVMKIYDLSGKMMHEMTGAKVPQAVENNQILSMLTEDNQRIASVVLRALYDEQQRRKE